MLHFGLPAADDSQVPRIAPLAAGSVAPAGVPVPPLAVTLSVLGGTVLLLAVLLVLVLLVLPLLVPGLPGAALLRRRWSLVIGRLRPRRRRPPAAPRPGSPATATPAAGVPLAAAAPAWVENAAAMPLIDTPAEAPTVPVPDDQAGWRADRAVSVLPGKPWSRKVLEDSADEATHLDGPRPDRSHPDGSGPDLRDPASAADAEVMSRVVTGALPILGAPPVLLAGTSTGPVPIAPGASVVNGSSILNGSSNLNGSSDLNGSAAASGEVPALATAGESDPGRSRRTATKKQQALLVGLDAELTSASGQEAVAHVTCRGAIGLIGADSAALVLRSIAGPRVLWQQPGGAAGGQIWGARTLGALLMRPSPVRMLLDGDPLADGARTAVLTAPIVAGTDVVGVLLARRQSARGFTVYDEAALARLAMACGARMPSSLERELLAASSIDRVTGLGNRALLMNDLSAALAGTVAHGMPVTLLVAEVDGLARLRTAKGPVAADVALAELAARVSVAVRIGDVVYRYGTDELAILLPATDESGAGALARRLSRLSAASFESAHTGLSLRTVLLAVEGTTPELMTRVTNDLAAARVAERWAAPEAPVRAH